MNRESGAMIRIAGACAALAFTPVLAEGAAPQVPSVDSGNTAWVLVSTALILLMTIPALAFFYGGLVKRKNVLSVLMQCFVTLAVVSLQWEIVGYSLAFHPGSGPLAPFIGGLDWAFLRGVILDPAGGFAISPYFISQPEARIPHAVFMIFQCMFAVITPALIIGAFAERMKFSAYIVFVILWSTLVYAPLAHWVWSPNGWLVRLGDYIPGMPGAVDFAGGIVVHISAGVAALVTAMMIGRRTNLRATSPHNMPFVVLGAGLLWVGWFGFNAGSALAADGLSAIAFINTNTAAAVAALAWGGMEWIVMRKPTMLGVATGTIAGLAAVTPAAGYVDVGSAMIIGLVSSVFCYFMVVNVKGLLGYDDALDAFGVHGVGGFWGTLAVGLFADGAVFGVNGLFHGNPGQFGAQLIAAVVATIFTLVMTVAIFKLVDLTIGLRVNKHDELIGLDVALHNERGYTVLE